MNDVTVSVLARLALDRVQRPVLPVVQLAEPPELKRPDTRAFATGALEWTSRTVAVFTAPATAALTAVDWLLPSDRLATAGE